MAGRVVSQSSIALAKRKSEYIAHKNRLIGEALQIKLAEEKANRREHMRNDLRVVKRGDE